MLVPKRDAYKFLTKMNTKELGLLVSLLRLCLLDCVYSLPDDIGICFPKTGPFKNYFPAEIEPNTDDDIYSVSNNQRISRPIVAYLCTTTNGNLLRPQDIPYQLRPKHFNISSQPAINVSESSGCNSSIPDSLIKVCQLAASDYELGDPRRFSEEHFRSKCSSEAYQENKLVIPFVPIHGNYLIAQGLVHSITDVISGIQYCLLRQIGFSVFVNGKTLSVLTNPIKIYNRIAKLNWFQKPQDEMFANQLFTFSLEIVDQNKNRITTGLDSSLIVEVTVGYQAKTFMQGGLVRDFLYNTDAELAGDEVITSFRNYDQVLHKRATDGLVEFKDVAIRDVYRYQFLFLNATLLVPRTGDRQPLEYSDLSHSCVTFYEMQNVYSQSAFCEYLKDCKQDQGAFVPSSTYKLYNQTPVCEARDKSESAIFTRLKTTAQTATELQIVDLNVFDSGITSPGSFRVPAHVQVPGLWVMVLDADKRRVFSGPDSALDIQVFTEPSVNLSLNGSTFKTFRGIGSFLGAVVDIVDGVQFGFRAARKVLESPLSKLYSITNVLHIGLFGRFNTAGAETDPDPVTATFATLAVEDINNNIPQFKDSLKHLMDSNLKINLKVYDTEQNATKALDHFMDMLDGEQQDSGDELISGIIGFGDNDISQKMNIVFMSYQLPTVTYREDLLQFISKESYASTFNLEWNIADVTPRAGALLQNQGSYLFTFEDVEKPLAADYLKTIRVYKYSIVYRIRVENQTDLSDEIEEAKKYGAKVVLCSVLAPKQYFVYRQAIKYGVAPMHGYKWITRQIPARQFDWNSQHPLCAMEPTCLEAFQGMHMIYKAYNLSGFSTDLWYHVNRKFFEMNHVDYYGIPTTDSLNVADKFALGYDAVLTFAYSFEKLLSSNEILSKYTVVQGFTELTFEGLTGVIRFSSTGGIRLDSTIAIGILVTGRKNTVADGLYLRNAVRWSLMSDTYLQYYETFWYRKRRSLGGKLELTIDNQQSFKHLIDIPIECVPSEFVDCRTQYLLPILPNATAVTAMYYVSTCGYLSNTGKLMSSKKFKTVDTICLRTELAVVPYICDGTCGGGRLNSHTQIEYKNGVCVSPNECRCRFLGEIYPNVSKNDYYKFGYSGKNCKNVVCDSCFQGTCVGPFNCSCNPLWSGKSCNVPTCEFECLHGKCIAPNYCQCNVGYFGHNCSTLIGLFIISILLGCVIVLAVLVLVFLWIKRRLERLEAIKNLDWLVYWNDVEAINIGQSAVTTSTSTILGLPRLTMSHISYAAKSLSIEKESVLESNYTGMTPTIIKHTAIWKGNIYYVKEFGVDSFNVNDLLLRAEINYLYKIRHPNLVRLFGVCLTSPNVCLLLEVVPKGSLADILQMSRYKISWSFKFSILRDIACGMEFLHNSNIGSHGNLKSTNCLIDNRWICKVSGFGVPTLRRKMYSVEQLEKIYRSMLWTAPELLRVSMTANELGIGTQTGDVYSFGIILTEVCNCENPFDYELQVLSIEELIRVLKNFTDPGTMGIKQLLEMHDYDTSKPIRPALTQSNMPEIFSEKRGIEELVLSTTAEDPLIRPHFKEIITTIGKIHPLKGELVQNLIFMLEQYTNHLQDILNEKVEEVQIEKNKTENLIKRLLPPFIATQMTRHLEVHPEYFHNVTILFSDIVGFTNIANRSQPIEVVELLNDLYTAFDTIIESFNVYKLETIGDAYCVASGVPTPVKDHYEQIATMSLHFVAILSNFLVRHLPHERIQIRIGIHTGSCVAAIVGIKMPRYCIFGEDVIIAQFMESLGTANAIQISESTARLLDKVGTYSMIFKEEVNIKFIGDINVYFLIGKQDLTIATPDIDSRFSQTKTIDTLFSELKLQDQERNLFTKDEEISTEPRVSVPRTDVEAELPEEDFDNLSSGRSDGSPVEDMDNLSTERSYKSLEEDLDPKKKENAVK